MSATTDQPEALDYPQLLAVSWRALAAHHVSELEMVLAAKVLELSFAIARPFAVFSYASELAGIAGMSRGKAHGVVARLRTMGVLAVDDSEVIFTFLPPSQSWPWVADLRVKPAFRAEMRHLEAELIRMNRVWPQQPELIPAEPDADREFADALAIERMRQALYDFHQEAVTYRDAGGALFPVTDRLPKPKPASPAQGALSIGEGLTRPLGTVPGGPTPGTELLRTSEAWASPESRPPQFPKREPETPIVPEKGTHHIDACINASSKKTDIHADKCAVPEKGTVPVSESERELMEQLVEFIGPRDHKPGCRCGVGMCKHGGWWRLQIREETDASGKKGRRQAVESALRSLSFRLRDPLLGGVRNPGGWMRDEYNRVRRAMAVNDELYRKFEADKAARRIEQESTANES